MPHSNAESERVTVKIPDMFVSFLAEPPTVNPNYSKVKVESEAWISSFCSFDEKMAKRLSKWDFAYFIGITAPDAPFAEYRTFCDFVTWLFIYDDMFDDGELRDKPAVAAMAMQDIINSMSESQSSEGMKAAPGERLPIITAYDTVWERVREGTTEGVLRRLAKAMKDYCDGALIQVEDFSVPTPEEVLRVRRLSGAVSPVITFMEYAKALRIPDYVFEHPVIQELELLCIDLVVIMNDILSYMREEEESVPHNVVAAARARGLEPQAAFDSVGEMVDIRLQRWVEAVNEVPSWGEEIDQPVEEYVRAISDVIRGNLYWSFNTQRYFGDRGNVVRETRCVPVQRFPAFLNNGSLSPV